MFGLIKFSLFLPLCLFDTVCLFNTVLVVTPCTALILFSAVLSAVSLSLALLKRFEGDIHVINRVLNNQTTGVPF